MGFSLARGSPSLAAEGGQPGRQRRPGTAAGGLGAAQGPQKPEGFRCSEMHSQALLSTKFVNVIVYLLSSSPLFFYKKAESWHLGTLKIFSKLRG